MRDGSEHSCDVVVVGARCAGSPLAALLARQGLDVAVLERASFPRDTLSSHLFEADALAFLNRLDVTERLWATGAPPVNRTDTRVEDVHLTMDLPLRAGDIGGMASVRRLLLDPILADAARQAGAEVHTASRVTGLIHEQGRVAGVSFEQEGAVRRMRARLVVGADGRHSTVARLCGARRYNVTPNRRPLFWAFLEDADMGSEPTFLSHRWADRFILGIPADSGLYQVLMWPEESELGRFRADREAAFIEHARTCEPLAEGLAGARRTGKIFGALRWEGFFREPSGPGWVLCGDAGHFKSPSPGRGIGDAFLQADSLARAIGHGLEGSPADLDRLLARWGRWRDGEFAEHYWLAVDLEDRGPVPAVLVEILRGMKTRGDAGVFFDVLNHRVRPSGALTQRRVLEATGRMLTRRGTDRRALLAQMRGLAAQDMHRRWLNRRPAYAPEESQARNEPPQDADELQALSAPGA